MVAAFQRALKYHAHSYSSLERILSIQATPKAAWETLTEQQQKQLQDLTDGTSISPRDSGKYQHLLFDEEDCHADDAPDEPEDNAKEDSSQQSSDEKDVTQE
jgi:hypothetical protein